MKAKKTIFERLFSYHLEQFRRFHGDAQTEKYLEWADSRIRVLLWSGLAALAVLFLTIGSLTDLSGDTIAETLVIALYLLYFSTDILMNLGSIKEKVCNDEYYVAKWRSWSIAVMILAASSGIFNIATFVSILDLSRFKTDVVEYEELGIKLTIPRQWSDIHWEYRTEQGAMRPQYRFYVTDRNQIMWIYVNGWYVKPGIETADLAKVYDRDARVYLDGGLKSAPETITADGMTVLKSVGLRKDEPDLIFVYYMILHQGCKIDYTYAFMKSQNHDEEMARADSMLDNIDLTAVPVPDHAYRTVIRKRKSVRSYKDYEVVTKGRPITAEMLEESSESVNIKSAKIDFHIPDGSRNLEWLTKNTSTYKFALDMGEYRLVCDTQVVWTSENASLNESKTMFEGMMKRLLVPGTYEKPVIVDFGNIRAYRAAGQKKSADCTAIRYFMIYKGARLQIEADIPPHLDYRKEMGRIDGFIKDIVFY